ncbi:MAG: 4-phosphoerythronate dehydrogenase [Balneolaceae bacterium]
MIQILADKHLYGLPEALPAGVRLETFEPSDGLPETAGSFDALLIRTVTPIHDRSLPDGPGALKLIASATAGTDHVDIDWLNSAGIAFRNAAGCNARAVAEYVVTSIIIWSAENGFYPGELKVGIVGVGHTGSEVADLLEELGIPYLAYDPPRTSSDPEFKSCTRRELLESEILTFHTPLTDQGKWATRHWLDRHILEQHPFELIINAARGGVIHEKALYNAFLRGSVHSYILDVWEHEPQFNDLLANGAYLKTPHIAGYSLQAKWRATTMVARELAQFFELDPPDDTYPGDILTMADLPVSDRENSLPAAMLKFLHPVATYSERFEELIGLLPDKKSSRFQKLRTGFPLRNEFSHIRLPKICFNRHPLLSKLGFVV